LITREQGNVATIDGAKDLGNGTYSIDILEAIDKGGAAINKKLTINLGADTEAVFKLQLLYKGEVQEGVEERVTCQVGKLEIANLPQRFVGSNIVSFGLMNHTESDIETSDLSVEIVSNNKATFQFTTTKNTFEKSGPNKLGRSTAQVDELAFTTVLGIITADQGVSGSGFAIHKPNGETRAEMVIKLKKGQKEIAASEKIIWEASGVQLKLQLDNTAELVLIDNQPSNLELSNIGDIPISTDDIELILNNNASISFKVGNESGNNIRTTLSKVLGTSIVLNEKDKSISFSLQLASDLATLQQYAVKFPLVFQDQNKNLLIQEELIWVNNERLTKMQDPKVLEVQKKLESRDNDPTKPEDKQDGGSYMHSALFPWEQKVRDNSDHIPAFGKRTIATSQLLVSAKASIPNASAYKKRLQNVLEQEGEHIPSPIKNLLQDEVNKPDDKLVQEINQFVKQDFKAVDQFAQGALKEAQHFAQEKDQQSLNAIERIDAWVAVVDTFVTEIGTQEAKDLATKVKGYQAEAQKLPKP